MVDDANLNFKDWKENSSLKLEVSLIQLIWAELGFLLFFCYQHISIFLVVRRRNFLVYYRVQENKSPIDNL